MSRASILSRISSVNASLGLANKKLSRLRAAKAKVKGVSTQMDYVVTNPGHLDGDKYDEMEQHEKDFVLNIKRDMHTKKSNVVSELDVHIARAQTEVDGLNGTLVALFSQLEYETD